MSTLTLIALVVGLIGMVVVLSTQRARLTAQATGVRDTAAERRYLIGLGIAGFGLLAANTGIISGEGPVMLKVLAAVASVILLGAMIWAAAAQRTQRDTDGQ